MNTLKISWVENPSTNDSYVDFLSPDATKTYGGYIFQSYSLGDVTYSADFSREVRTIIITTTLKGQSTTDLNTKIALLNSFITKTRNFIKRFRGNIPSSASARAASIVPTDSSNNPTKCSGNWFPGSAAVLLFQPDSASQGLRIWNILDGQIDRDALVIESLTQSVVSNISVKLTVDAYSRNTSAILTNYVNCGDFESEHGNIFNIDPDFNTLPPGWSSSVSITSIQYIESGSTSSVLWSDSFVKNAFASQNISTFGIKGYPKHGAKALVVGNGFTGDIYTNGWTTNQASSTNSIAPNYSFWFAIANPSSGFTGTFRIVLQTSNDGTTWSDISTGPFNNTVATGGWSFVSSTSTLSGIVDSGVNDANGLNSWYRLRISGTGTNTYTRLKFSFSSFGTSNSQRIFITGVGAHDYFTDEYLAGNWSTAAGSIRVYGLKGDTETPCQITSRYLPSATLPGQYLLLGYRGMNRNVGYSQPFPLRGQDFLAFSGNADTSGVIFSGYYPTAAAVSSANSYTLTAYHYFDHVPRRYLAFLYYAADQNVSITGVQLLFSSTNTNLYTTFNKTLPSTYTHTGAVVPGDFRMALLGELTYPNNPGGSIGTLDTSSLTLVATTLHSGSSTGNESVIGVYFMPFEQFGLLEFSSLTTARQTFTVNAEGSVPTIADVIDNTKYKITGWDFRVAPDYCQFDYLWLSTKDNTVSPPLLTPIQVNSDGTALSTSGTKEPWRYLQLTYSPRYYLDL